MIRVAFTLIGGENWTGGRNYLANILKALSEYQRQSIEPLVFVDPEMPEEDFRAIAGITGVQVIRTGALSRRRQPRSLILALIWGYDPRIRDVFLAHRVELVFEAAQFFGWRLGIPALAWIPDFQHRALPKLFTWTGFLKRELGFRAQVLSGRAIMLSSEDARYSCERFYPSTVGRTFTVRFAVSANQNLSATDARKIADQYGLPQRFFFLPNQFWQHKNHYLVLEALGILHQSGDQVTVAATGRQLDPRDPRYFEDFDAARRRAGIAEQFLILGLVPHEHVVALMLSCAALLNPSRFEGWSTTVEEARALGTPLILSSIAVHREQAGGGASYFDPNDARALAVLLRDFVALSQDARNDARVAAQFVAASRVGRFAEEFAEVARSWARAQGRAQHPRTLGT